jgi:putative phage-type endonuclease
MLTIKDMVTLTTEICILCERYICENLKSMSSPNFETDLFQNVFDLLKQQLPMIDSDKAESQLKYNINYALNKFVYVFYVPRRSNSYINKTMPSRTVIKRHRKQIHYLENMEQPEQRTEEWYIYRKNRITASDAWKCVGSDAAKNRFIVEKCTPIVIPDTSANTVVKKSYERTDTPFHHGKRFEPLSVLYYEYTYNTRVGEFGCIPHPEHKFIAASPDGINIDETSPLYGRMLEIKNIVNREINGNPKLEYWIQMQLQMETCNLNECDFLETRFKAYESEHEFEIDGTFQLTNEGKYKGIILHFIGEGAPHYEYCPFNATRAEFEQWEQEMREKNCDKEWFENIYWYLDEISCVIVMRNKMWFANILPEMTETWNNVIHDRVHGYEHRRSTRAKRKNQEDISGNETKQTKLTATGRVSLFNINTLEE